LDYGIRYIMRRRQILAAKAAGLGQAMPVIPSSVQTYKAKPVGLGQPLSSTIAPIKRRGRPKGSGKK